MALTVGELVATLKIDDKDFQSKTRGIHKGMTGVADDLTSMADNSQSMFSRMGSAVSTGVSKVTGAITTTAGIALKTIAGVATAVAGLAIFSGFKRLKGLEEANKMLEQMGLDAGDIKGQMEGLNNVLDGTPYALNEGAAAMASLISAGVPLDKTERALTRVADAAAYGNVAFGEMSPVFQRISLNGRATIGELNQLADRNIPIFGMLADAMGLSVDEVRKMASDGKITADVFDEAWDKAAKGFGANGIVIEGAAKSAGDTVGGSFGNMRSALARLGARIMQPGYDRLVPIFQAITAKIKEVIDVIGPMIDKFAESPRVVAFLDGISVAIDNLDVEGFITRLIRIPQAIKELFSGDLAGAGVSIGKILGLEEDDARVDKIIKSIETIFGTITSTFSGDGAKIGGFFSSLFDTALKLVDPLATIATSLGKATAATGVSVWKIFLSTLEPIAKIIDTALVPPLEFMARIMEQNQDVVTGLVAAFTGFKIIQGIITGIVAVKKLWAVAQGALNAVMAANPITILVIAIAALVAGLVVAYRNVDWFRNAVDSVWRFLKTNVLPIFQSVVGFIKDNFVAGLRELSRMWSDTLWPAIQDVAHYIADVFTPIVDALVGFFKNVLLPVFETVASFFTDTLIPAYLAIANAIIDRLVPVVEFLVMVWAQVLWPALKKVADFIIGTVVPIFGRIITTIVNVAKEVGLKIGEIVGFVIGIPERIAKTISNLWNGLKEGITDAAEWVSTKVNEIVDFVLGIPGMIGDAGKLLFDIGKDIIQGLVDGVGEMFGAVKDKLGDLTGKLTSWKGPPEKDRVILKQPAQLIMGGFVDELEAMYPQVQASLGRVTADLGMVANSQMNLAVGGDNTQLARTGGVTVHAQTNADPHQIADAVAWRLRVGA